MVVCSKCGRGVSGTANYVCDCNNSSNSSNIFRTNISVPTVTMTTTPSATTNVISMETLKEIIKREVKAEMALKSQSDEWKNIVDGMMNTWIIQNRVEESVRSKVQTIVPDVVYREVNQQIDKVITSKLNTIAPDIIRAKLISEPMVQKVVRQINDEIYEHNKSSLKTILDKPSDILSTELKKQIEKKATEKIVLLQNRVAILEDKVSQSSGLSEILLGAAIGSGVVGILGALYRSNL